MRIFLLVRALVAGAALAHVALSRVYRPKSTHLTDQIVKLVVITRADFEEFGLHLRHTVVNTLICPHCSLDCLCH